MLLTLSSKSTSLLTAELATRECGIWLTAGWKLGKTSMNNKGMIVIQSHIQMWLKLSRFSYFIAPIFLAPFLLSSPSCIYFVATSLFFLAKLFCIFKFTMGSAKKLTSLTLWTLLWTKSLVCFSSFYFLFNIYFFALLFLYLQPC